MNGWVGLVASVAPVCSLLACTGEIVDPPTPFAPVEVCTGSAEGCAEVDFEREIQPLLSEHCVRCHGGVRELGGLNLQNRAAASRVLGHAGDDATTSSLYARVVSTDPGKRMPLGAAPLPPDQVAKLRRWIEVGAPWPTHWSYRPLAPVRAEDVPVSDPSWLRSPIDNFVLNRLDRAGIVPAPDASPATLMRRLALDLTGLPPTPEEEDGFAADPSESALQAVVDRLLASPAFGERWGRHWLDQARYSDSDGYEKDLPRPNAWRYRDWVVDAFNQDLPFDQFTQQQIAGDLLLFAPPLVRLGTAFHRQTLFNAEGGADPEEDRVKRIVDRTATVANTWLGLTLQCTQCHGHPYDDVSQQDFYRLYAFFDKSEEGTLNVPVSSAPGETQQLEADVLKERVGPVETRLLLRGNFLTPDTKSAPLTPSALNAIFPFQPRSQPADRLDLARWLVEPRNPLTARVRVNTIWSHLFGRGIVASVGDFGTRGELPSHPELLDWLADDFVRNGFAQKRLIRQIVLSRTYRQASVARPELADRDPENALLSRQARFRLEAEPLRDGFLAVSGLLTDKRGGRCVFPPIPEEMRSVVQSAYSDFQWVDSTGPDRYRRSIYTFHKRSAPHPSLSVFGWPPATASVNMRERASSPLQALTTLHDVTFMEAVRALAKRVRLERPAAVDQQIVRAFRLALCRAPSSEELAELSRLYADTRATYQSQPDQAAALLGDAAAAGEPDLGLAALVGVARVITNLDEFITRE
jgi:hypothetical protein